MQNTSNMTNHTSKKKKNIENVRTFQKSILFKKTIIPKWSAFYADLYCIFYILYICGYFCICFCVQFCFFLYLREIPCNCTPWDEQFSLTVHSKFIFVRVLTCCRHYWAEHAGTICLLTVYVFCTSPLTSTCKGPTRVRDLHV